MINFSGLLGRGGGALELEPILFLFSGTVFFKVKEEERWEKPDLEGSSFWRGKARKQREMKKMKCDLNLKCPNIEPLRLHERTFALVKGPEFEKLRGVRLGEWPFALTNLRVC